MPNVDMSQAQHDEYQLFLQHRDACNQFVRDYRAKLALQATLSANFEYPRRDGRTNTRIFPKLKNDTSMKYTELTYQTCANVVDNYTGDSPERDLPTLLVDALQKAYAAQRFTFSVRCCLAAKQGYDVEYKSCHWVVKIRRRREAEYFRLEFVRDRRDVAGTIINWNKGMKHDAVP